MNAYEACQNATSTHLAPWYVVPADDKENARLISQIVLDALKEHKMAYPKTTAKRRRELKFVVIVFGNQATTYTNRERRRLGFSCPSRWLIGSSVVDLLIASTLATCGIAMTPLPILVVGGILVAAAVFAFILDFAKVPVFNRLRIA